MRLPVPGVALAAAACAVALFTACAREAPSPPEAPAPPSAAPEVAAPRAARAVEPEPATEPGARAEAETEGGSAPEPDSDSEPDIPPLGPADIASAVASQVPSAEPEELVVLATHDHQRRTYALLTAPVIDPDGTLSDRVDIWLAALDRRGPDHRPADDRPPAYQLREGALARLYDAAVASTEQPPDAPEARCSVQSSLRARDLDGDGELEITAIAAFLRPQENDRWLHGGGPPDECGAVAFIVGDDFEVQATFTREYGASAYAASETAWQTVHTTWRVQDLNQDGHGDLVVVERWRYRFDFEGDYIGDGETAAADRERLQDRRALECLWTEAVDRWVCPDGITPGQYLFGEPAARDHGQRPW